MGVHHSSSWRHILARPAPRALTSGVAMPTQHYTTTWPPNTYHPPPTSIVATLSRQQFALLGTCKPLRFPPPGATTPSKPGPPHCRRFTIMHRERTLGRSPLDEWSARRRDRYLTKHKRQISMPQAGFEPTIPANEWRQTHGLDRAAACISAW